MRLIIATKNKNKVKEIRQILKGLNLRIVSLYDLDRKFRIVENGRTFKDNAVKKALVVSKVYKNDLVMGEDSGLVVECLGGEPGVYSKRYAGRNANDYKNNLKVLKKLEGLSKNKRRAYFFCFLALSLGGKIEEIFEGRMDGLIHCEICGDNGFGYDPIFYLPSYKKTVAQLHLSLKNRISHRSKAFRKLKKFLEQKCLEKCEGFRER
ncbi:MAG: XTP/dITP diphosphatase [Candidatus Omnitrophica bacterium]|nr:XTP/dITP diphosphatase [Candidatus Omnitrophota bacterium]MBD3269346.1 XTP/dITP diphosphatase [Candidatus Omnitrophota bacterium]